MEKQVKINLIYEISEDVVSREIEGELIIIPITSGIGDAEDDLYSLNESGKSIWKHINGKNSVDQVIKNLKSEFDSSENEIKNDVFGLMNEFLRRGIISEIKNA